MSTIGCFEGSVGGDSTTIPSPSKPTIAAVPRDAKSRNASEYPRWHTVAAGAAAGAGARLLTAPLDLLKIRRQLAAEGSGRNGLFASLSHIVHTEGGIRSLFRGNVAATYLWIGYAAVQFSCYARTSDFIAANAHSVGPPHAAMTAIGSNPTAVAFASGATAGVCATIATYPFDICRTALAARGTSPAAPNTVFDFCKTVYKGHGIGGFFAGSAPAVVQIIPYMGINFALYDYLCRFGDRNNLGNAGLAGAAAGGISKFLVYPMDTVKKRLQAQVFQQKGRTMDAKRYNNVIDCVKTMARDEGVAAFYRGLVPTVMKSMIATGLTFAIFKGTKDLLEHIHDESTFSNGKHRGKNRRSATTLRKNL